MTTESTTPGELTAPVSGDHTTDGVPHGYTSLTPFLVVEPATAAIAFYCEVFGAEVLSRMPGAPLPDGTPTVSHAELDFGRGILQLGDPMEGNGLKPQDPSAVNGSICVYVRDVDAVVARAVERGATIAEQPSNFVSGDRFASIMDPFARRWSVMTRVEDLSREESEARVNVWLEQFLAGGDTE
ncbi:VOC family protein [Arthrobacter sp.]|uniref:VOC family protein n=1 Tax=Arthrobacter sp. TaxID=1667 RepID=UPI003A8F75EB